MKANEREHVIEGHVVLYMENDGAREEARDTGPRERIAGIVGTLRAGPLGQGLFRLTAEVPGPSDPELSVPQPSNPRRPVSEVTP